MANEEQKQPYHASSIMPAKYKIIFLGNQAVGKTSLIQRFIYDTYEDIYQPTIGIDFLSKTMYVEDKTVKLHLWDTAGDEKFRSLIPTYVKDAAIAVIMYDITERQSFSDIAWWAKEVREIRGNDALTVLVGNKCDDHTRRVISKEEGEAKAKSLALQWFETSAKTGEGVEDMFGKLAGYLPGLAGTESKTNGIELKPEPEVKPGKKKKCCR